MLALPALALGVPRGTEPVKYGTSPAALGFHDIRRVKAALQAAELAANPLYVVSYTPLHECFTAAEVKKRADEFLAANSGYFDEQYRQRLSEMKNWIPKSEAQKAADDMAAFGTGILRIEA